LNNYRLFETDEFRVRLADLDSAPRRFVESKLKTQIYPRLKVQPYSGPNIKKLRGYSPETWRVRLGQFRLFFAIDPHERVVSLLTIDYRKDAYK
jgi:mRNA interferase RelE/StbE